MFVKEILFKAYSNLAMAHSAVANNQLKYTKINFMIRSKLYKGLITGKQNVRSFFDDEKVKLDSGRVCNYCGSLDKLSLDHIIPKKYGGKDDGNNLITVCLNCNSSKGIHDLIEWMLLNEKILPLMVIRRYLKLIIDYCIENDLMDKEIEFISNLGLPFNVNNLTFDYPCPDQLILYYRSGC